MPSEIRNGIAEMALTPVEENVSREEVRAAVQAMLDEQLACLPWPGLWLEEGASRNVFSARYDLMARDWGGDVAAESRSRMDEFVELGFLDPRETAEGGVDYSLTALGREHLVGSPFRGARPSFCGPLERRVVAITALEFGRFPCGNLLVRFTHAADALPAWARTEGARERVEAAAPVGQTAEGAVTLRRQWFRRNMLPRHRVNGALQSACYDPDTGVTSDDLTLAAGAG
jgi:hypothetical protein